MLAIMMERAASPKEVAERVGEPIGKVSYHVREMHKAGVLELVETRKRRGATQHFYRAPQIPLIALPEWSQHSPDERRFLTAVVIQLLMAELGLALDSGTFDERVDRHLCRVSLRLDERGWGELHELYDATTYATLEIRRRAAERLERAGEEGSRATAAVLSFELPELASEDLASS